MLIVHLTMEEGSSFCDCDPASAISFLGRDLAMKYSNQGIPMAFEMIFSSLSILGGISRKRNCSSFMPSKLRPVQSMEQLN